MTWTAQSAGPRASITLPSINQSDDAITEAVAGLDDWLTTRGWVLDEYGGTGVVSWAYPPSAAVVDDESREPVTRMWVTVTEDDAEVLVEFGAAVVGAGEDGGVYVLDPDRLADHVAALEAYRPGSPRPELG